MSTQIRFDLDGLATAIGAHDASYQLALYDEKAEVRIVDGDHPQRPLGVLRGRSAIKEWLDSMSSPAIDCRVVAADATPHTVSFTEECHYPDGTELAYRCQAEIERGRIRSAQVTLLHPRREPDPAAEPAARWERRERVARTDRRRSTPGRGTVSAGARSLPGNFLG